MGLEYKADFIRLREKIKQDKLGEDWKKQEDLGKRLFFQMPVYELSPGLKTLVDPFISNRMLRVILSKDSIFTVTLTPDNIENQGVFTGIDHYNEDKRFIVINFDGNQSEEKVVKYSNYPARGSLLNSPHCRQVIPIIDSDYQILTEELISLLSSPKTNFQVMD